MPLFQTMAERANQILSRAQIERLNVADFVPGATLGQLATQLGIAGTEEEAAFLNSWPPALQSALIAMLRSAIERREPVALTWAPGYDFEVRAWEARATAKTPGGITIQLRSRYPGE